MRSPRPRVCISVRCRKLPPFFRGRSRGQCGRFEVVEISSLTDKLVESVLLEARFSLPFHTRKLLRMVSRIVRAHLDQPGWITTSSVQKLVPHDLRASPP